MNDLVTWVVVIVGGLLVLSWILLPVSVNNINNKLDDVLIELRNIHSAIEVLQRTGK